MEAGPSGSRTQVVYTDVATDQQRFKYLWRIKQTDLFLINVGHCVKSRPFNVRHRNNTLDWRLLAFPKGEDNENKNQFSIYLQILSSNRQVVKADVRFSVTDPEGRDKYVRALPETCTYIFEKQKWGYLNFIKRDVLLNPATGYLYEDRVYVSCNIKLTVDNVVKKRSKSPQIQLAEGLESLLNTQQFCDVTLRVDGRELRAHIAILAAHSPVFANMFRHEMKDGKVLVKDVTYEVAKQMLCFMYSGVVKNVGSMMVELLAASVRYEIPSLMTYCEVSLSEQLKIKNTAPMLMLAERYDAQLLKKHALHFLNDNMKEVLKTASWKQWFELPAIEVPSKD